MGKNSFIHCGGAEYSAIARFTEQYSGITYYQLDDHMTKRVNLFAIPDEEHFFLMDELCDKIIASLSALKRIASKPITRLKDVNTVMPVESVRVIDHSTMRHISLHTEYWGNIDNGELMPRKLMTLTHEEQYKIYENIAFAELITEIMRFVRTGIRLIKNVVYSCQPLNYNLLERTNHLMHFLAIGKLHIGYVHAKDNYHYLHGRCMEKLLFIEKTLSPVLSSTVYKKCRGKGIRMPLKRTNVFRLQKDYKRVYDLLTHFKSDNSGDTDEKEAYAIDENAYADYCTLLSVFSAGHFNFEFAENERLYFRRLQATAGFKAWSLKLLRTEAHGIKVLKITVEKDYRYSALIIFGEKASFNETKLAELYAAEPAEEYIFASDADRSGGSICLNIFDIDSFRRIQQIILRGMVYSDEVHDVCPFCGAAMHQGGNCFECEWCKTLIRSVQCPKTEKVYYTTELKDYKPPRSFSSEEYGKITLPLRELENEAMYFYRNITEIDENGKLICPHCGEYH